MDLKCLKMYEKVYTPFPYHYSFFPYFIFLFLTLSCFRPCFFVKRIGFCPFVLENGVSGVTYTHTHTSESRWFRRLGETFRWSGRTNNNFCLKKVICARRLLQLSIVHCSKIVRALRDSRKKGWWGSTTTYIYIYLN